MGPHTSGQQPVRLETWCGSGGTLTALGGDTGAVEPERTRGGQADREMTSSAGQRGARRRHAGWHRKAAHDPPHDPRRGAGTAARPRRPLDSQGERDWESDISLTQKAARWASGPTRC